MCVQKHSFQLSLFIDSTHFFSASLNLILWFPFPTFVVRLAFVTSVWLANPLLASSLLIILWNWPLIQRSSSTFLLSIYYNWFLLILLSFSASSHSSYNLFLSLASFFCSSISSTLSFSFFSSIFCFFFSVCSFSFFCCLICFHSSNSFRFHLFFVFTPSKWKHLYAKHSRNLINNFENWSLLVGFIGLK